MFFSNFNIRFSNKVSRTGYKWEGDELALKQDGGFKEVEYSIDTFVDFKSLTKYYLDTERTKTEGLIFCNKWGSLTSENSKKPEYLSLMNSMHVFESLRKDLELKKQPVFQEHQQIDLLNLTYEWNNDGNAILPTYHPTSLWSAIKLTFLLCGVDTGGELNECLHYKIYGQMKGCKHLIEGRSDKKFCSDLCRVRYHDKQKAKMRKGD